MIVQILYHSYDYLGKNLKRKRKKKFQIKKHTSKQKDFHLDNFTNKSALNEIQERKIQEKNNENVLHKKTTKINYQMKPNN